MQTPALARRAHPHTYLHNGHGRRVRRTIKVLAAPAWITFTGAAQIAQIRRTVTRGSKTRAGKTTVEGRGLGVI